MRNRCIAIFFILFIFSFGIFTIHNAALRIEENILAAEEAAADGEAGEKNAKESADGSSDEITGVFTTGFNAESIAEAETLVDDNFGNRTLWINVNGLFQRLIGKDADIEKDWYRLDNGQMIYSYDKKSDEELSEYSGQAEELNRWLESREIPFLYVQLPSKIDDDSELPAGTREYGNSNADYVLRHMEQNGVETLDIRERIRENGWRTEDLFYQTDQHWKAETAMWAASEISEKLEELLDGWITDEEYSDMENFRTVEYENWFLGSIGKKTGDWYTGGADDFRVITPRFDTSYRFTAQTASGRKRRQGSFEDVMIVKSRLVKDYYNINTYAAYTGGDYKSNTVTNENAPNDFHILLIRDSFSCTLMPFLSLYARQITTLDLRYYDKMSVEEYVDSHDIDMVIVAYNPSALTETQFTFS